MGDSVRDVLWRFAPMIYGPTVLFALGEGAVLPLIPVMATHLGADIATSGLVASALVIGQLCGNLPSGWLVARMGERVTMAGAGAVALLSLVGLALAPTLWVLTVSVFVLGLCAAAFALARHAFMTTRVPVSFRARALSLLGGAFRLGMFAGPFVAALLLGLTGASSSAVWFFAACLVACLLLVLLGPDPETRLNETRVGEAIAPIDTGEAVTGGIALPDTGREGVFRTIARYRVVLSRLGLAAALLAAVRSARQVVLPLWGVSLGLDAQSISLVVGIAGALDFALFYVSGQVMDRFGRLWAALPSTLLMGTGFLVLSFTHDLASAEMWYGMFAAVIGVGNGLSSGILLTLAADIAPRGDPAPFLGAWRTLTDAGGAAAPVLFSGIVAIASLSVGTAAMGAIGLLGAIGFARWVPRFVQRRPGADGMPKSTE
jgi:MFS family permease